MVLTRKFEVGFSELSRKETDNLQLLLSVLLCIDGLLNFIHLSFYLRIHSFGCAGCSFLCEQAFSSCNEWELLSSCGACASHFGGFSGCRAWALGHTGFSSCPTWT